jgi:SAM-dependent methyltransferase
LTILFEWTREDLEDQVATCEEDGLLPLIAKYVPRGSHVLESGCGTGRYVRYLQDRGWNVTGLELSEATVAMVRDVWPDLEIVQGDAARSPFPAGSFDGVLSLGVVEHWVDGPAVPLADLHRVLRPGGVAIITVPCHNSVRGLKRTLWWDELAAAPRAVLARLIKKKRRPLNRLNSDYKYVVFPPYGGFFEYRMTVEEFANEILRSGFQVLHHQPIGEIDGLYHDLNPFGLLVRFRRWKFYPTSIGRRLNEVLSRRPFLHSHMQAIVAQKPS